MLNKERLEKKAKKAAEKHGLTPEEAKVLANEAYAVYDYIASDLSPDNEKNMTCKRSTIIEVSLDAGRLEQQLKEKKRMTPNMEKFFRSSDGGRYRDLIDVVGPAFGYEHYEVSGESL